MVRVRERTGDHGRQSGLDENVAKVMNLDSDYCLSIRLIAEDLNMCKTMAHNIISENLNMQKVCSKLVRKVLSDVQERRVDISHELLVQLESERDFPYGIVTGDKSWVL